MGGFVVYMLQVSVVMSFLYLAYKLLMAPLTFHVMNRFVLLGIYAVSWVLPLLLPFLSGMPVNSNEIIIDAPQVVDIIIVDGVESDVGLGYGRIMIWCYLIGLACVAVFTAVGAFKMIAVIRSGRHLRRKNYIEVISGSSPGPFSWGRYIVLRPCDIDESYEMVMSHERVHLESRHWLDLIPAQLTVILQWFSPAAWLLMRELRDVHEYCVDKVVAADDPVGYQMMLIKKTVGSGLPLFADSLNHSQIKKRITMMMTKKSKASRRLLALSLPSVAVAALMLLSQPVVADVLKNISSAILTEPEAVAFSVTKGKINDSGAELQTLPTDEVFSADTMAESSEDVANESAVSNEQSASAEPAEQNKDVNSEPPAYFVNGKLLKGSLQDIDPNTIVSMSILKNDPDYPQGKVMIVTGEADPKRNMNEDGAYRITQKIAEFKGGQTALMQYLSANVKWPADAKTDIDKPVRCIVQFTINADGSVSNAKILRPTSEPFDNEALRVVQSTSGMWIPGENDGKPVATMFTLPVTFKATAETTAAQ